MYRLLKIICILTMVVLLGFTDVSYASPKSSNAPLFNNLGNHHHPISTKSQLAQRYFDQGLILTYGFNQKEAERSFREAAKINPDCAICHWGVALVLGSNINVAMDDEAVSPAWEELQTAVQLSGKASEKEKAYIQALTKRYSPHPVADSTSLNLAYANAMREVAKRYPDDLDAATLFADSLMNTMPWNYWQENGEPKAATKEVLATLESVLKRNPNHPGANHLYIHLVEAVHPESGVTAADRLRDLVPGSGHLLHMPSHIYIRVGRYHDAAIANQKAIASDMAYLSQSQEQGIYPFMYVPHNYHMLWTAAMMEGNEKLAMSAAKGTASMVPQERMQEPEYTGLQHYFSIPMYTLVRFGKWDEILAQPAPAKDLIYPRGVWHYARGMAFTAKGEFDLATEELEKVKAILGDWELTKVTIWDLNNATDMMAIAAEILAGKLAAKRHDYKNAIAHLRLGVTIEDKLIYDEPPSWYYPVRQPLGEVLIQANRSAEAEDVFCEDLQRFPENGWSLWGLVQSLQAQGKNKQAQVIQKRFTTAWQYADFILTPELL